MQPTKVLLKPSLKSYGPTTVDFIFMVFLVVMLGIMLLIGKMSFSEGRKVELSKSNGEAWVEFLKKTSLERFDTGFQLSNCRGEQANVPNDVLKPATQVASSASPPAAANTWGDCLKSIIAAGSLSELRNPYTDKLPELIEKCDFSSRQLAGGLVFEKLTPTLPGMAVAFVASPLVGTDVITQKLQIRLTVCDGGAYPIPIGIADF